MEDVVELGLEAFDHGIDRYHDNLYEGYHKVGPYVAKHRHRSGSAPQRAAPQDSQQPQQPQQPEMQNTREPEKRRSGGARDDYYNGHPNDDRRGRRQSGRGDEGMYDDHDRVEEWARRSQAASPPHIQLNDNEHIYPSGPQPMKPPYPTAGQLVPMPPDAQPLERSRSQQSKGRYDLVPRDNYEPEYGQMTRSRSANYGHRRDRSRSRSRDRSLDRSHRRRSKHDYYDDDNKRHSGRNFNHLTAGLAGALAGGLLGRNVSKGDTTATVAGALVGALGAGVAEREWGRHKSKRDREDGKWEKMHGRR